MFYDAKTPVPNLIQDLLKHTNRSRYKPILNVTPSAARYTHQAIEMQSKGVRWTDVKSNFK